MSKIIKAESVADPEVAGYYLVDCKLDKRRHSRAKGTSPEEEARLMIENAREEAETIISEARAEAESIRTSAYEEGNQAAEQELEAAKSVMDEDLAEIETDAQKQIEDFWKSIEPELLKLSVEIAGKIIRREIDGQQDFIVETIKAGLYQLRDRRDVKIRVNPKDYKFIRERKEDLAASFDGVQSLELIDDRRVGEGGCVIESANGHLDAGIDTQSAEIERALLEAAHEG